MALAAFLSVNPSRQALRVPWLLCLLCSIELSAKLVALRFLGFGASVVLGAVVHRAGLSERLVRWQDPADLIVDSDVRLPVHGGDL
jgi:hypothetical protein